MTDTRGIDGPAAGAPWSILRERCPACDAVECAPYAATRGVAVVRCAACRVVYVRAAEAATPTASGEGESLAAIYDARYFDRYLKHSGYARRVWRDRGRARLLARYHPRGRLLDVGCSIGHFLEAARQEGWDARGVEPAAFAAEFARRRGHAVTHGLLQDAGFPAASFDAVTLWHVIEHLPDLTAGMGEVRRVLQPGGLLALLTPNVEHPMARLHGPRWKHIHHEHLQLFSHRTLPAFLRRLGFEPVLCRWLCRHSEVMVFALKEG